MIKYFIKYMYKYMTKCHLITLGNLVATEGAQRSLRLQLCSPARMLGSWVSNTTRDTYICVRLETLRRVDPPSK
jgi:hypothetical protein